MEVTSTQLLHELETIRAYLFLFLFVGAGIFICILIATISFVRGIKELLNITKARNFVFREEAEELLVQNKIEELLTEVNKRLETHPDDAYAFHYQGIGLYKLSKFHESKRSFNKAYELEPGMDLTNEQWIARIDEKLKESAPKIID